MIYCQPMQKAKKRLDELLGSASIVVLASHSNEMISEFCNKAIVMDSGRVVFHGTPPECVDFYSRDLT